MFLDRIKQAGLRLERAAVHGGVPVPGYRGEVLCRGVSLVVIETVAWIDGVQGEHLAVAGHFGDDRGGRDRAALAVSLRDPALGDEQIRNTEGVHQHHVRQRCDRHDGAAHGLQRGAMDVDCVDLARGDRHHRPGDRPPGDLDVKALALERRDCLRVGEPRDVAIGIEDHRTGRHRSGQAAAANLVATGDAIEPPTPDGVLEGPTRTDANHAVPGAAQDYARLVSFIRAALPFRFRRKYSLARRTRADRTTSTLAMVGECSGKMRSTPCPNDTLRTVNEARVPPRCRPMTMPSKIWMRSLSPSRTFTCTRTVSPDFMSGRSVICDFSTSSIALIACLLTS